MAVFSWLFSQSCVADCDSMSTFYIENFQVMRNWLFQKSGFFKT